MLWCCCGESAPKKEKASKECIRVETMDGLGLVAVVNIAADASDSEVEAYSESEVSEDGDKMNDPVVVLRSRRTGVSAEAVTIDRLEKWKRPSFPKSIEEQNELRKVINTQLYLLFSHLSEEDKNAVIDMMSSNKVPAGHELIKQGEEGDNFYVVKSGHFNIFVSRNKQEPLKVAEVNPGGSFGELAIMYNAPRAATCIATIESEVWALDRDSFQMMLVTIENTKAKEYEGFLESVDIFKSLTKLELGKLSDILTPVTFKDGECVIKQGTHGEKFYIVAAGEAEARISEDGKPEVVVKSYVAGAFFGEVALLAEVPRKASIYAKGDISLLWISKTTFDRVLGPVKEHLAAEAEKYPKYADFFQ